MLSRFVPHNTILLQYEVCCSVLQCVAVCCSVLQCVAVCCSVLQSVAVCCSLLQSVAVCCSVLQSVALLCSVLQCVAVCFVTLKKATHRYYITGRHSVAVCCTVLQYVAVCYSVFCHSQDSDTSLLHHRQTFSQVPFYDSLKSPPTTDSFVYDMTHSCVTCLIHVCHDSFTCAFL